MRKKHFSFLSALVILICLAILAGTVYMLVRILPKKEEKSVTTLETAGVFNEEEEPVEPDREDPYKGALPPPVEEIPAEQPYHSEEQNRRPDPETAEEAEDPEVLRVLASMTLEEKVWQLFFVTPEELTGSSPVTAAGETTQTALESMPVGGMIYFSQNLETADQVRAMLSASQDYCRIPMLLGTDEEGGTVDRIGENEALGGIRIADMQSFGEAGDPAAVHKAGEVISDELKALGFNMDFAPVADVSSGKSSLMAKRSFSTDPDICATMVRIMVGSLSKGGVVSCLKHFPGYGSVSADAHLDASSCGKTLEELEACDFLPFAAGIEAGAPFVMVSLHSVPEVTGSDIPCVFSEKIISLLRNKIGFGGVIITDSFEMGAITGYYEPGEAAVKALEAGCDMILMPYDLQAAADGVFRALEDGTLSEQRLDESVARILRVKSSLGLLELVEEEPEPESDSEE